MTAGGAAVAAKEALGWVLAYKRAADDSPEQEHAIAMYEALGISSWQDRPAWLLNPGDTGRLIGDELHMSEDQRLAAKESISKLACALDGAALDYLACGAQVAAETGKDLAAGVSDAMDKLTHQQAAAIAGLAVMTAYQGMPRESWEGVARFACRIFPRVLALVGTEYIMELQSCGAAQGVS